VDLVRSAPSSPVTWHEVAKVTADELVPDHADWVVLHVRSTVMGVVRSGHQGPLVEAGITAPTPGEELTLITLRHHHPDLEVALHRLVLAMAPRVGDPYGSGRVVATGTSRIASHVDPAHLRAIATDDDNLRMLQELDLGSAVIAPLVASGTVIGALNLVRSRRGAVSGDDLVHARQLGRRIGDALDSSRPATSRQRLSAQNHPGADSRTWSPTAEGNPVATARQWIRRTLPELLDRPGRAELADELDLVVSELAGNALRHAGSIGFVQLERHRSTLRVSIADPDERSPLVRAPTTTLESGRGMLLIEAVSRGWGVEPDLIQGGKRVWADLSTDDSADTAPQ
jgi:anti-sigma regulatory factor (Ser/Thr protein kinase)